MRFKDRSHAARMLADRLLPHRGERPLILAMPRGAAPMARIIADALDGDLDVVLVRKLRSPTNPDLAIGAIDEAGTVLRMRHFEDVSEDYLRAEIHAQAQRIHEQRSVCAHGHAPVDPAGRFVIIVDDGIATGASMSCAIRAVRARGPRTIVVATAVADRSALARVRMEADDVVCLNVSDRSAPLRDSFDDFSEVTDAMVVHALRRKWDLPAAS